MNPFPITCVVFDFDGTLSRLNIDFEGMRKKLSELIENYRIDHHQFATLYVLEVIEAVCSVLAAENRHETGTIFAGQAFRLIHDIEMEGAREGNLLEGMKEMLCRLHHAHIKVGIITRNCLDAVYCVWPDVHSFCDALITRESAVRVKPDPAHLRQILAILGAAPGQTIMTGDHPMDIHVGKTVGTFTVGVLTGNSTEQALRGAGADRIIERASSIDDCLDLAGSRGNVMIMP